MTEVMYQPPSVPTFTRDPSPYFSDEPSHPQPIPSFSFPARPVTQGHDTAPPTLRTPANFAGHRRARTSVNLAPTPLPDFSFHPSTPAATSESSTAPKTPKTPPASQASPTRGHRRIVTEFGGNRDELAESLHSAPLLTQPLPTLLLPTDPNAPSSRGHRHRRSAAISSKDLSGLLNSPTRATPASDDFDQSAKLGGGVMVYEEPMQENPIKPRKQSLTDDGLSLSRSVEFSDTVEVIPRPVSMVSLESGSSQSTVRDSASNLSEGSLADPDNHNRRSLGVPSSYSFSPYSDDGMYEDLSGIEETNDLDLSANFDDDPTDSVVSPMEGGFQWSQMSSSPATTPTNSAFRPRGAPYADESAGVIDLDMASVDSYHLRPYSASGYDRKRASMNINQLSSNFLGSAGGYRHRRAESAPSLAPPSFSASFRGALSHGDGYDGEQHVLENVFEEDEEETELPVHGLTHSTSEPSLERTPDSEDPTVDATLATTPNRRQSTPCLLPAIQFSAAQPADDQISGVGLDELPLPQPPFAASDTNSGSAASSPRCCQSVLSSSEPSPRYRKSVDDVPSLISGASTVGSVVHPNFPSLPSGIFEGGASVSGSTFSLASSKRRFHRKRGSIISLSRWVGVTRGDDEDETEAFSTGERPQTAAGLMPPKQSKGRRLSRMLKFWKTPKVEEGSEI